MRLSLKPILPKSKQFNAARYKAEIEKAQTACKEGIRADFAKTTATWRHKVKFTSTRQGTTYYIGTSDEIYGYVDKGTKPHIIRPRGNWKLRFFRTGFKAKTKPGIIASYAGKMANKDLTFANLVHHPGTKARSFSKKIAEKWKKEYNRLMMQAIRKASRG